MSWSKDGENSMAGVVLILTDSPASGERLARALVPLSSSHVLEVRDPNHAISALPVEAVHVIVCDVCLSAPSNIAVLRQHRSSLRATKRPFLCLLREDTTRNRIQANAIGATRILRADTGEDALLACVSDLLDGDARALAKTATRIASADRALSRIFQSVQTGSVSPELIDSGATYIMEAVHELGVREWLEVIWRFDDSTHQHCLLVAGLAAGFSKHLGFGPAECARLTKAALLHDVGKAKIPAAVLNKTGPLTPTERAVMQTHPVLGYHLLQDQGHSAEMLAVVRSHHEYLDGSGYPDGLSGAGIPDLVRLVTVCDIYGALIERRSYKAPMAAKQAFEMLESMGNKLDRHLVRAFRPFASQTERSAYAA